MTDPDQADIQSVTEVLRGNPDAFRGVVERYGGYVYRIALLHLRSPENAEDAVQEIFARVFNSLGGFQLDRRFKPWLVSIALNHLKTTGAKFHRFTRLQEKIRRQPPPKLEDPEETVFAEERRHAVREVIQRLPANLRIVVILYYLEEMKVEDISEVLQIGRENVKSRLHRARRKLRGMLENGATACDLAGYNKVGES